MTTTEELAEVVMIQAVGAEMGNLTHLAANLRAAASRLSEMDAENKRLEKERAYAVRWGEGAVESVKEVMWRYEDALKRIAALPRYTDGDNEAQDIARAALDKGEPKP